MEGDGASNMATAMAQLLGTRLPKEKVRSVGSWGQCGRVGVILRMDATDVLPLLSFIVSRHI